jgi:hypothetical protein
MKPIRDEFNLYPVLGKLGDFSEYLEDVEELIDSKAKELDKVFAKRVQEVEQGSELDHGFPFGTEHYVRFSLEEDLEKIENVFPNLLRRSLFVYVFSVLEDALVNCCKLLNYQGRPFIRPEGKGGNIFKARKYLVKAGVTFPEWGEIEKYARLRNCIVHSGGRLETKRKDERDLRAFVKRKKMKSLLDSIPCSEEANEVIFHQGFCEEVIRTISSFLEQLRTNMERRHRNEDF